jgi:hypothetical protein
VEWQVLKPPMGTGQKVTAEMGATLPLAGLKVKRTMELSAGNAVFVVHEEVWKTAEYPWFNAWRHVEKGKPLARGLEFGTTGLHQPFPILVAKGRIFGRSLFEYLDAGETRTKSYTCFLFQIPRDYRGAESIRHTADS